MKTLGGLTIVAMLALSGCVQRGVVVARGPAPAPAPVVVASNGVSNVPSSAASTAHFARSLGIPPGQLPPPGQCRVWYPGTPPGRQPRPGSCGVRVPAGAWLISRPADPKNVRVAVYDNERPNVISGVAIYIAATGQFLREER